MTYFLSFQLTTLVVKTSFFWSALLKKSARLLHWVVFKRVRSTFLFICSETTTGTTDVQNILEKSESRSKQRNDVQNLENILRITLWLSWGFSFRFFWHYETSGTICNTIYIFRHCDTVQNSKLLALKKFIIVFRGFPFIFLLLLQLTGVPKSPKAPPF